MHPPNPDYNPYLHGPLHNKLSVPPALIPPEDIRVERPVKIVYDFTKRSNNMKLVKDGKFEGFDY